MENANMNATEKQQEWYRQRSAMNGEQVL